MSTFMCWVTAGLLVVRNILPTRFEVGEGSLPAKVFPVGPNLVWAYRTSVPKFYLGTSTQSVSGRELASLRCVSDSRSLALGTLTLCRYAKVESRRELRLAQTTLRPAENAIGGRHALTTFGRDFAEVALLCKCQSMSLLCSSHDCKD